MSSCWISTATRPQSRLPPAADSSGLGPQPVGFLDHPGSWGCDTVFIVAEGCTPAESGAASEAASRGVNAAARALDGRVDLITTDCGYILYAEGAFDGVSTPVMSSSLALLDFARHFGEVAIVASSGESLRRLIGDLPSDVRVIDLRAKPEWERYGAFTMDMEPLDRQAMASDLIEALEEDFAANGRPDALVLDCTALPQFRPVIRSIFSGPVVDVANAVHWLLDIQQPQEAMVQLAQPAVP